MLVNPDCVTKKTSNADFAPSQKLSIHMQSVLQLPFQFSVLDNWRQLIKLGKVQDDIISLHQSTG